MADRKQSEKLRRDFTLELDERSIDSDARTVTATISTETPVDRGMGELEVLEHSHEAVDMSRAKDGLPLLWAHNQSEQIGIVEQIRIEARKLRGVLRFGSSTRAREIWEDVKASVIRGVSVGYIVRARLEESDRVIASLWQPLEVSLVSVPADANTGIGRSFGSKQMSQENTAPAAIGSDRWKRAEDDRRNRIRTLYDITGRSAQPYRRLLEECLSDFECTPERFRDRLTELVEEDNDRHVPDGVLGGLPAFGYGRQVREFSIIKAVRHMSDPKSVDAGFEIEVTQELARGTSSRPGAFIIPLDKPLTRNPRQMQLEHRAVTKAGAASMVGTLQAANLFIDALRARTVTMQMGATMLPGQVQDVSIPKKTAAASVGTYDLDGTASISAADPTLGAVTLSPAEFAGLSGLSWKMMVQGLPEAEAMLLNDLATGIAVEIDRQALEGDGTGSNFSGITLQADHTPTAAAITYAALLGQEAAVASANADLGPVGYVLEPGAAIALKDDATVTSVAGPVWVGGAEGTIGGIRAMYTGNLSNGSIYSGNWADLIIATWGNGVALDTSIHGDNFAKGTTSVRAILSGGLAVRHAESFSWQEST